MQETFVPIGFPFRVIAEEEMGTVGTALKASAINEKTNPVIKAFFICISLTLIMPPPR
jgi:hypothetical protein